MATGELKENEKEVKPEPKNKKDAQHMGVKQKGVKPK